MAKYIPTDQETNADRAHIAALKLAIKHLDTLTGFHLLTYAEMASQLSQVKREDAEIRRIAEDARMAAKLIARKQEDAFNGKAVS